MYVCVYDGKIKFSSRFNSDTGIEVAVFSKQKHRRALSNILFTDDTTVPLGTSTDDD
jgi:hypothetical protein